MTARMNRALLVLVSLGIFLSFSPAAGAAGNGTVVGGIRPCRGVVRPSDPLYAAGTVTVLRGYVTRVRIGRARSAIIFPKQVVTRQTVKLNQRYHFSLAPGHYVLTARLPGSNVHPYVQVGLKAGATHWVNIPNMCK